MLIKLPFQVPVDMVPPEIASPLIVPERVAFPAESIANLVLGVAPLASSKRLYPVASLATSP